MFKKAHNTALEFQGMILGLRDLTKEFIYKQEGRSGLYDLMLIPTFSIFIFTFYFGDIYQVCLPLSLGREGFPSDLDRLITWKIIYMMVFFEEWD